MDAETMPKHTANGTVTCMYTTADSQDCMRISAYHIDEYTAVKSDLTCPSQNRYHDFVQFIPLTSALIINNLRVDWEDADAVRANDMLALEIVRTKHIKFISWFLITYGPGVLKKDTIQRYLFFQNPKAIWALLNLESRGLLEGFEFVPSDAVCALKFIHDMNDMRRQLVTYVVNKLDKRPAGFGAFLLDTALKGCMDIGVVEDISYKYRVSINMQTYGTEYVNEAINRHHWPMLEYLLSKGCCTPSPQHMAIMINNDRCNEYLLNKSLMSSNWIPSSDITSSEIVALGASKDERAVCIFRQHFEKFHGDIETMAKIVQWAIVNENIATLEWLKTNGIPIPWQACMALGNHRPITRWLVANIEKPEVVTEQPGRETGRKSV